MKSRDHSDRILRRIAEGIQEQIDCTQCANCCKTSTTEIGERDIDRLTRRLGTGREDFLRGYTMRDDEGALSLQFNEAEGGACSWTATYAPSTRRALTRASAIRTWCAATAQSPAVCGRW